MATNADRMWPLEIEARNYLKNHKILELFNNLTALLMFYRPEDPRLFLIDTLKTLQKSKMEGSTNPCLFDDYNIKSLFGMLDLTDRGFITYQQYANALESLGIKNFNEQPQGRAVDRIFYETFRNQVKENLKNIWSTFYDESERGEAAD